METKKQKKELEGIYTMEKQKDEIMEEVKLVIDGKSAQRAHVYNLRVLSFGDADRYIFMLASGCILTSLFMLDKLIQFKAGVIASWGMLTLSLIAQLLSFYFSVRATDIRLQSIDDYEDGDKEAFEKEFNGRYSSYWWISVLNYTSMGLCIVGVCVSMVLFSLYLYWTA